MTETVKFRIEFWDYYKRQWKSYEVECPGDLKTIEEYADCISQKLAENYSNRLYKECVKTTKNPDYCMQMIGTWTTTYKDKMKPIIEEFLESEGVRRLLKEKAKKIAIVSEDFIAMLQRRNIALAKLAESIRKGRKVVMGLSSTQLVMFDTDCRKYECLSEIFKLAILLCKIWFISSVIYPTRRGFHLLGITPVPKPIWREIYVTIDQLLEEGRLKHIDRLHIHLSLARGFSTLSVSRMREIHYIIYSHVPPGAERAFCVMHYIPTAMYLYRVLNDFLTEFDLVEPARNDPFYRDVRNRWIEFLKGIEI